MGAPQWILVAALAGTAIGAVLAHGKRQVVIHDRRHLALALGAIVVEAVLLTWGGFWS
jgi:hypothetical protein